MWNSILSVPDHCLFIYSVRRGNNWKSKIIILQMLYDALIIQQLVFEQTDQLNKLCHLQGFEITGKNIWPLTTERTFNITGVLLRYVKYEFQLETHVQSHIFYWVVANCITPDSILSWKHNVLPCTACANMIMVSWFCRHLTCHQAMFCLASICSALMSAAAFVNSLKW